MVMVSEIEKGTAEEAKKQMTDIIRTLRKKMAEIDVLTNELKNKRDKERKATPKTTKRILEEIKVPSLDLLR